MARKKKAINEEIEEEIDEKQEIQQPSIGFRRGPMIGVKKTKLDHKSGELWKWMLSYISPYKWKFFIYFLLLLIGTVILSVAPLISTSIIDDGIGMGNTQYVIFMSAIYFSLLLFMAITNYISQYGMGKISQKITFEVRSALFYKLQDMSLTYFDQRPSGDVMSITTNDVNQLNLLIGGQFVLIITNIVTIGLTISIMFILNWFLALLSLAIIPIFFISAFFFRRLVLGKFKESRKTIGKVTSSIQENIAGAKVVKAYGQEKRASTEFDQANTADYQVNLKIRRTMATIFPLFNFIITTLTAAILLIGGFVSTGVINIFGLTVTVGVLTAYISLLSQFFRPFMMLLQIQQIMQAALAASDRIVSLLEESVEIPDPSIPKSLSDPKGNIEFEDVGFGYILENADEKASTTASTENITPSPMQSPMMQNPMIKRAIELIKSLPEPYSSFMMKNGLRMPQDLRQKLFMNIMGKPPQETPAIIDKVLAEFHYAVPNTDLARKHPDYKTSFKRGDTGLKGESSPSAQFSITQMIPPELLSMMLKNLEKSLSSKGSLQQSTGGSMGGEGQGLMGGGMTQMPPQMLIKMLATTPIPPEIEERIPKIVKDAIEEEKKLIKRQESKGFVLKDLDLNVKAGNTLAIAGETGAGKTTLIKLIGRFYDLTNGKILIDGVDIKDITKKELRELIGLVPQDAYLFTGTIKENLLYAYDNPSPEIEQKMIEVSKFLGLHNFVETLNKKYDTKLKENASNISIGQRQLIAFARALITDPKILILDEATSSVDPYTETLIQDALDKARKGRTTIIIAHRLSTIKNADHIIVLSANKKGIIEQGDHESLMALNGKYKRLLEMQHRDIGVD